jgi:hypothetical protein
MTVTIRIEDQIARALEAEAKARGMSLEEFLQQLAEGARTSTGQVSPPNAAGDFDAALDELFAGDSRSLPSAAQTYSREDIYADHD